MFVITVNMVLMLVMTANLILAFVTTVKMVLMLVITANLALVFVTTVNMVLMLVITANPVLVCVMTGNMVLIVITANLDNTDGIKNNSCVDAQYCANARLMTNQEERMPSLHISQHEL